MPFGNHHGSLLRQQLGAQPGAKQGLASVASPSDLHQALHVEVFESSSMLATPTHQVLTTKQSMCHLVVRYLLLLQRMLTVSTTYTFRVEGG